MAIILTDQLTQDLITIDPYFPQKKQMKIFGVCINTMTYLRDKAGLTRKPKGRPKGTALFREETAYPKEVQEALKRIPDLLEKYYEEGGQYKQLEKLRRIRKETGI